MTLKEAIEHSEEQATRNEKEAERKRKYGGKFYDSEVKACLTCVEQQRQIATWLKILKKAKFEYDEAHRIITCPTPDVTSYDRDRAQIILDTFRGSLGKME